MTEAGGLRRRLGRLRPEAQAAAVARMGEDVRGLYADWQEWRHGGQRAPRGDWRVWVMLAGRGFGKTRAGAEWVHGLARAHPGAAIALVGANPHETRAVMVEGRSGLLATAWPGERARMRWSPTRRRLTFASGAEAALFSGSHADGLRGAEHHFAWCDELAKWGQAKAAWANLMLGLRAGAAPRALVTTTPRRGALLQAILDDPATARSGGATRTNPHLPRGVVADLERRLGGTRFGRQELDGELMSEADGALWPRALIEACRAAAAPALVRVVIGVDPPAGSDGDACGIVACGLGADGAGYVLADHSVGGLSPEGWALKVRAAAEAHHAIGGVRVVAEANNGGRMVEAVLRGAGVSVPVKLVHASEGKAARAAPVAALFESGRAWFAGLFPALEAELAGLAWGGGYEGPGRSPDRADAMVWALSALMLGRGGGAPSVRLL